MSYPFLFSTKASSFLIKNFLHPYSFVLSFPSLSSPDYYSSLSFACFTAEKRILELSQELVKSQEIAKRYQQAYDQAMNEGQFHGDSTAAKDNDKQQIQVGEPQFPVALIRFSSRPSLF